MATEGLATVATCMVAIQAQAIRWALEQEGIQVFVADENLVTANWFLGNAAGYIKVQVPSDQTAKAREILDRNPHLLHPASEETDTAADDDSKIEELSACLSCGAVMNPGESRCKACGWSYADDPDDDHRVEGSATD